VIARGKEGEKKMLVERAFPFSGGKKRKKERGAAGCIAAGS